MHVNVSLRLLCGEKTAGIWWFMNTTYCDAQTATWTVAIYAIVICYPTSDAIVWSDKYKKWDCASAAVLLLLIAFVFFCSSFSVVVFWREIERESGRQRWVHVCVCVCVCVCPSAHARCVRARELTTTHQGKRPPSIICNSRITYYPVIFAWIWILSLAEFRHGPLFLSLAPVAWAGRQWTGRRQKQDETQQAMRSWRQALTGFWPPIHPPHPPPRPHTTLPLPSVTLSRHHQHSRLWRCPITINTPIRDTVPSSTLPSVTLSHHQHSRLWDAPFHHQHYRLWHCPIINTPICDTVPPTTLPSVTLSHHQHSHPWNTVPSSTLPSVTLPHHQHSRLWDTLSHHQHSRLWDTLSGHRHSH